MKRDFKFRAWDKDTGSWMYADRKNNSMAWFWNIIENYNCEIMQFTGLKDKNGKEIYEGDIVGIYHCSNIMGTQAVKWNNLICAFVLEPTTYPIEQVGDAFKTYKDRYEVIGNIYENQELLKEA